jgi:hypothetical protein
MQRKSLFLAAAILPVLAGTAAAQLKISLGIRETGTTAPIGQPGGQAGPIEWINLDGQTLNLNSGLWQTFTWTFGTDPVTSFTGNGVLDGTRGTIEHLRVQNNGVEDLIELFVDNVVHFSAATSTTTVITDFEGFPIGTEVLFQEPSFSGSTNFNNFPAPNSSAVSDLDNNGGTQAGRLLWGFRDNDPLRWNRLTTFPGTGTQVTSPTIEFNPGDQVKMDLKANTFIPANRWTSAGGGDWNDTSNWGTGVAPNSINAAANFLSDITGPATINVDSFTQVAGIRIKNANPITISGTETLDMSGTGSIFPVIRADQGNHVINAPINILKNLALNAATPADSLTINSDITWNEFGLEKTGNGLVQINRYTGGEGAATTGALVINGGTLRIKQNGGDTGTSVVDTLTFRGGAAPVGRLDLVDNDLIIDYATTPPTLTRPQIIAGRNAGAWNGNGITSSAAASNPNQITGLGLVLASDYTAATGLTTFSGKTIDGTAWLIKYTYNGDTDLNGSIDFDDYARIDTTFLGGGVTNKWFDGDFDYSDSVDFDDYALIDAAFLLQGGPLDSGRFGGGMTPGGISAGMTAMDIYHLHAEMFGEGYINAFWSLVPEPSSLSLLALGAMAMGRRRRA